MDWLMSANLNVYDHGAAFEKYGYIDWRKSVSFEEGDNIYLYVTAPIKKIRYKCVVSKTGLNFSEKTDDKELWTKQDEYWQNTTNTFDRITIISEVNTELLNLENLKENGLKQAPQSPIRLTKEKEELKSYISDIFKRNERMDFPSLNKTLNNSEFKKYTDEQKVRIIKGYLFEGKAHRELDEEVLGLNSHTSKGFPTMVILHHLGLVSEHKNFFSGYSIEKAIQVLNQQGLGELVNLLLKNTRIILESEANDGLTSVVDTEGKRREIYTVKYERSPKLRESAVRLHGYKCKACSFDFEATYGDRGNRFIEVHHIKPLYTLQGEVEVNPETDLVPLCANCHRIVHRKKNEIITIEELKKILASE